MVEKPFRVHFYKPLFLAMCNNLFQGWRYEFRLRFFTPLSIRVRYTSTCRSIIYIVYCVARLWLGCGCVVARLWLGCDYILVTIIVANGYLCVLLCCITDNHCVRFQHIKEMPHNVPTDVPFLCQLAQARYKLPPFTLYQAAINKHLCVLTIGP